MPPRSIFVDPAFASLSLSPATGKAGAASAEDDTAQEGRTPSSLRRSPPAASHGDAWGHSPSENGRWAVRSCLTSAQGPRPKQEDKHIRVDDGWAEPKPVRSPSPIRRQPQPPKGTPSPKPGAAVKSPFPKSPAPPGGPSALPGGLLAFYGVYDGHGGSRASGLASRLVWKHLRERLVEAVERGETVPDAPGAPSASTPSRLSPPGAPGLTPTAMITGLRGAFEETEAEILRQAVANRWRDGCTAVCALLSDDSLVVGNIGDSRAVLCQGGRAKGQKIVAIALSEDHKPELPSETSRIIAAGGHVRCVQGIWRLNGELSLSRALGDAEFKPKPAGSRWKGAAATQAIVAASRLSAGAGASSPNAACRSPPVAATPPAPARASALSAEPEFTVRRLSPAEDHFLLLACDGLWDVLTDAEACRIVVEGLHRLGSPQEACDRLVETVLRSAKCTDNVSVVLVMLDWLPDGE